MQLIGNILIVVLALAFLVVKPEYKGRLIIWVAVGVALLLVPLFVKDTYWNSVLFFIFLYITVAQVFNIMAGYTGQVLMGQSSFFGMGFLITRLLWENGLPFFASILAGAAATVGLACAIGLPTLRLKGAYFAIGTLGAAIALLYTVRGVFPGVSYVPSTGSMAQYYLAFGLAALAVLVAWWLINSRPGLAMVAIREDEDAAASSGINTFKYKTMSLFIATFLAGLAGGVYAFSQPSYYYYSAFNLTWSLEPLMIGFIGGVGTIVGPTAAAAIYYGLKEIFSSIAGNASLLIFGILFILVVLFLPGGLVELGAKIRSLLARIGRIGSGRHKTKAEPG